MKGLHMRAHFPLLLAAVAFGAAACSDDSSGVSGDEAAVLQEYDASDAGYFEEDPGGDGALENAMPVAASAVFPAPGDPFVAPEHWGRRRFAQRPSRDRVVVIQGDTAFVRHAVRFDGRFLVDSTHDGLLNPGAKPLRETMRHRAVFVRDDTRPHGWRLVGMSLGHFFATDPDHRTVRITAVTVNVNGTDVAVITDPDHLYRLEDGLPHVSVGDSITVTVAVSNTTGTALVPPTQVFLHVRHSRAESDSWRRLPMADNGNGTWTAGWTARRTGIGRLAVDALDSESLQTQAGDDYRANLWAVPYRVQ
jgi:hypothetical protein